MRLLYWIKEGLRITAAVFAAAAIYMLLTVSQDSGDTWQDYLYTGTTYLVIFGAFMTMALNATVYQVHIPLTISFGSTRAEALLGIQCYRLTIMLPVLTVSAILVGIAGEAAWLDFPTILLLGAGAFLAFNGLGGVLGIFSTKLSKGVLAAVSIAAMLLAITVLGLSVLLFAVIFEQGHGTAWIILGLGALVYALCSIAEARTLKGFRVK